MAVGETSVKICGMRDLSLCEIALGCGADYIGMIHHPASPRHIEIEAMAVLRDRLPTGRSVGVVVAPNLELIQRLWDTGIDVLQVHLKQYEKRYLEMIREQCPAGKSVWLVPKWAPGTEFPNAILPYADSVIVDTYSEKLEGGTGETGDWKGFRELCVLYPQSHFILSGGLKAGNICAALEQTGAKMVDLSSGVELRPGVKTEALIRDFFSQLGDASKL